MITPGPQDSASLVLSSPIASEAVGVVQVRHDAALLLVNFNTSRQTLRCLASLLQGVTVPGRVMVLDNHSRPDDLEHLKAGVRDLPPLRFQLDMYRSASNLGFAAGSNLLIGLALSDPACNFVLMLNNDAVALPHLVQRLLDAVAGEASRCGMAGARMHKLARPSEIDTLGISIYQSLMPADRREPSDRLFGPTAGCCVLTRGLLERLAEASGYWFDPRYFCYCEDTDLVIRAVLLGFRAAYVDELSALHEGQASSNESGNQFIAYHGLRNSIWMHAKLVPSSVLWRYCALLMLAHLLSAARHVMCGRSQLVWRIYWDAVRRLPEFVRERRLFRSHVRVSAAEFRQFISPGFYRSEYISQAWSGELKKIRRMTAGIFK